MKPLERLSFLREQVFSLGQTRGSSSSFFWGLVRFTLGEMLWARPEPKDHRALSRVVVCPDCQCYLC